MSTIWILTKGCVTLGSSYRLPVSLTYIFKARFLKWGSLNSSSNLINEFLALNYLTKSICGAQQFSLSKALSDKGKSFQISALT